MEVEIPKPKVYTWIGTHKLINKLIGVLSANAVFDVVVGVSRGGLIPAVMVADYFNKPLFTISASHYKHGELFDNTPAIKLGLGGEIMTLDKTNRILIVDDVYDTGLTVETLSGFFKSCGFTNIQTAVLINKAYDSIIQVFEAQKLERNFWVVFPWQMQEYKSLIEGAKV